jgi:DNA-binding LacI/PurR family transcriptional regulator
MADVARLAGVSQQTVSRVVNESHEVRPETRERVRAAMQMLDYRPNSAAQALATGRSRTLGVVTVDTALHGPASTLFGIERAAHAEGYHVSVVTPHAPDRRATLRAAERLRAQGVAGILVIAPRPDAANGLRQLPTDVAVVAIEARGGAIPSVAIDNARGAELATRHLLDLGHRAVWHLAGPADWTEARHRAAGWRSALRAAGAPVPPALQGDWTARAGYALGGQLLGRPEVTAVFAANDQMALGLLRRLHEAGRDVPGTLSLVGFDDLPESPYFTPPLTTVRQDFIEIGRRSVRLLLSAIGARERSPLHETIAPELIVRGSTAPPAE